MPLRSLPVVLENNRKYQIRLNRLFEPKPKVVFEGEAELFVQRNSQNEVVLITPKGQFWAEYTPEDFDSTAQQFISEDYAMAISN